MPVDPANAGALPSSPANLMRQLAAAPDDPPLRLRLLSKSPELERHWNGGA